MLGAVGTRFASPHTPISSDRSTRVTWTAEDLGAFAASNPPICVSPRLLEHLIDQTRSPAAQATRPPPPLTWLLRLVCGA